MSENSTATRKMKDSGVEWIGEIPEDWEIICVRHLFRIGRGRVIAQTELKEDGEFPVYSSQTMSDGCLGYLDTYDFDADQLTWTTDGANAGTVFLRRGKYNCTNVCGTLLPCSPKIEIRYQKYSLEYISFYHKRADTNGYKIMNNEMAAIKTIVPPIDTQRRIADFLDDTCGNIDRYIEKQQQIIDKLKEYKQAVITEAVTKGLNPDVPMKDSGIEWIGMIPSHWNVIKFKHITEAIGDGLHGTPEYDSDGEYYFLNGHNIGNENLVFKDNTDRLSELEYKKYKPVNINENTILITLNGATYGKTSFYNNERVLLGKSAGYITLNDGENKYFVRLYLQSHIARLVMELSLCGSTIANLSLKTLNEFVMPYPPCDEQEQIVGDLTARCAEIDRAISKRQSLIDKFTEYKKSLIYEAVTGKLEV